MSLISKFKEWMFSVPQHSQSVREIVLWWEMRRIAYNIIVGAVGICSLQIFYFFISRANKLKPGEDAVEPVALLVAPIVMNICYTAGWVVEAFISDTAIRGREAIGPRLLRLGLGFSLMVIITPTVYWGAHCLIQAVGFDR